MLLNTTTDSTQTSQDFESQLMGVEANGRMFSLLLKNLYTNPYGAIVRELCTNALDAHVLIGNEKAFHVQLPSKYDSNFIIRDFGPGLDDYEINKYLNTLFSSNKTTTNTLAGGFGLGSKSPFALVDSFNIESYKNGIKYTGLWYKKECGTPVLIIIDTCPTQEPNGLKFIVPALPEHAISFKEAFDNQLFNFHLKPLFFHDIEDPSTQYFFEYTYKLVNSFKNLKVFKFTHNKYNTREKVFISIGGVLYPYTKLNINNDTLQYIIKPAINESNLLSPTSSYTTGALVLEIPIGSVTIPMNRESIEESESNIKYIQNVFESVEKDWINFTYKTIADYIEDHVTNQKDYKLKEFLEIYKNVFPEVSSDISLPNIFNQRITFKTEHIVPSDIDNSYNYRRHDLKKFKAIHPNDLQQVLRTGLEVIHEFYTDFEYCALKGDDGDFKRETSRYKKNFRFLTVHAKLVKTIVVRKKTETVYKADRVAQYAIANNKTSASFVLISGHIPCIEEYISLVKLFADFFTTSFDIQIINYEDLPKVVKAKPVVQPPVIVNGVVTAPVPVQEPYFKGIYQGCITIDKLVSKDKDYRNLLTITNYNTENTLKISTTDELNKPITIIEYLNTFKKIILIGDTDASQGEDCFGRNYSTDVYIGEYIIPSLYAAGFKNVFYCTQRNLELIKQAIENNLTTFEYIELDYSPKNIVKTVKNYLLNTTEKLEQTASNQYFLFLNYLYNFVFYKVNIPNISHTYYTTDKIKNYVSLLNYLYKNSKDSDIVLNKELDAYIKLDVDLFFKTVNNFFNQKLRGSLTLKVSEMFSIIRDIFLQKDMEPDMLLAYYIAFEEDIVAHIETSTLNIYDLILSTNYYQKYFYQFTVSSNDAFLDDKDIFQSYLFKKILKKHNLTWNTPNE